MLLSFEQSILKQFHSFMFELSKSMCENISFLALMKLIHTKQLLFGWRVIHIIENTINYSPYHILSKRTQQS